MNWVDKLERKYGKYSIHNLMYYIIILYAVGYLLQIVAPELYFGWLSLDPTAIVRGQLWRMVTFIIYPPSTNLFYFLMGLYLYYSIGKTLEYQWGAFRFNLYFFSGVVLHVIAAFICQYVFGVNFGIFFGTYYLNFSLFFAFAATYPDMEFLLFFIIPIKAKWLGIINGIYFGATILAGFFASFLTPNMIMGLMRAGIFAHPAYSVMALISLANFLIYFFSMRNMHRYSPKEVRRRRTYERSVQQAQNQGTSHKCAICGRTEGRRAAGIRFCSKCNGNYEYCQEHLFTHEHVK